MLVVPSVFGRVTSSWRRVTVHTNQDGSRPRSLEPDRPLRVACYNIAHGRGLVESNWEGGDRAARIARLDRIAELLRDINADVVVLNEVDFDSSWSYSVNQARYLARKAGYSHWVEQRNLDLGLVIWKWRFGNAILSKYPIENARVTDLPGYSTWETVLAGKKRAVACDIKVGDRSVCLVGAHLSHRSEAVRVRSVAALVDVAAKSNLPTIVAGDLNSSPPTFPESVQDANGNNAIAALDKAGWFQRTPTSLITANDMTYHSRQPSRVIDWIVIPPKWQFLHYQVKSSKLSDHRPVVADIAFGRP